MHSLFYGCVSSVPENDEHRAAKESYGWIWGDVDKALKIAAQENKRVLVYVWSRYCTFCAAMDREVFPNETIKQTMFKYYVPVIIDLDSNRAMANSYGVITGTPTFYFVHANGTVLGKAVGYRSPAAFKALLEKFAG